MKLEKSFDIFFAAEYLSKKSGVDKYILISSIETSILKILKFRFNYNFDFEIKYDFLNNKFVVYRIKRLVSYITDYEIETTSFLNFSIKELFSIKEILFSYELSLFESKSFEISKKQAVNGIKFIENIFVFNKFKYNKGNIFLGIIKEIGKKGSIVEIDSVMSFFPIFEYNSTDNIRVGDKFYFYILDVLDYSIYGYQIIVSRRHPNLIVKLLEKEIPEIKEGIINIINIVRESGKKSKIAVNSHDSDIDPVGSLVGSKSARIHNIVKELRGEKIDVILFNENILRFIMNSLSNFDIFLFFLSKFNKSFNIVLNKEKSLFNNLNKGLNLKLTSELIRGRIKFIYEKSYLFYYEKKYFFNFFS